MCQDCAANSTCTSPVSWPKGLPTHPTQSSPGPLMRSKTRASWQDCISADSASRLRCSGCCLQSTESYTLALWQIIHIALIPTRALGIPELYSNIEKGQLGRVGHPRVHGYGNIDGQETMQGDGLVINGTVARKGRDLLCTL